jgi:hypothetical protein
LIVVFTTLNKDATIADVDPQSLPGLGAEFFDLLTGRRAEITYHLDNMEVHIPTHAHGPSAAATAYAVWKFNSAVCIRSRIHSDGA